MTETTQASQPSFDGKTTVYRWFVFVGPTRFVTWAPTEADAIAKTEKPLVNQKAEAQGRSRRACTPVGVR